ncbi:MAG: sulfotransferase, partial [Deltaproteobacteria bacterium]
FLDKTPAYGLILDFLEKLYPRAKYVVLSRHPVAVLHSFAHSFFDGRYRDAWEFNPIVARYVPAIARFLREKKVSMVHVRYEDLVTRPEEELGRIFEYLDLPMQADAVEYGKHAHVKGSFGDPITVEKYDRPTTEKMERWAADLASRPDDLAFVQRAFESLDPEDLEVYGYPVDSLFEAVGRAGGKPTRLSPFNGYRMKRKVMLALKSPVRRNTLGFGTALRRIRYYCDVLLRE